MNKNTDWLTTVPASDGNFKIHLRNATVEEINEALSIMAVKGEKGNASRIAACSRELRKRNKLLPGQHAAELKSRKVNGKEKH